MPHRFLVTAGNTREYVDDVRAITNVFTGKTGLDIAAALKRVGPTDLLTSNVYHVDEARQNGLGFDTFDTHADLIAQLKQRLTTRHYDGIFMTAAVADYHPQGVFAVEDRETLPDGAERWTVRNVQKAKVSSRHSAIAIYGTQTQKIVDMFRRDWAYRGLLVKFKLEVGIGEDELKTIAEASRQASDADYIVANTLEMVQGDRPGAWLLSADGQRFIARAALAEELAILAETFLNRGESLEGA